MSIFKDHILENKVKFPDEKVDRLIEIYRSMVKEVEELEMMFPDRHFTLDGHLVGSMGEAIAANRYGIELKKASYADFDGTIYRHPVQIKIVQQDNVTIHFSGDEVPFEAYLLVLYMNKNGYFYEVYNGSLSVVWDSIEQSDRRGNKHIVISKLMELQSEFINMPRLDSYPRVSRMKVKYKNAKNKHEE